MEKKTDQLLSGVKLKIKRRDPTLQPDKKSFSLTSDSRGAFKTEGLIAGYYWVETPAKENEWLCRKTLFYVDEGETVSGKIEVTQKSKLEISIVDINNGEPKEGYHVFVRGKDKLQQYGKEKRTGGARRLVVSSEVDYYSKTDKEGKTEFYLAEGTYRVEPGVSTYPKEIKTIKINAGETQFINYKLGEPKRCYVSVIDPNGDGVEGIVIQVFSDRGGTLGKTDSNGVSEFYHYVFKDNVGAYFVVRDSEKGLVGWGQIQKDMDELILYLEVGAEISGRLTDNHGNAIANAELLLYEIEMEDHWEIDNLIRDINGAKDKNFVTNEDGHFELNALPRGFKYELHIEPTGYVPFKKKFDLNQDLMKLGEIILERADLTVSGVVVDEDGKPVAGMKLGAFGNRRQPRIRSVVTDKDGNFTFTGVTDAKVTIIAGDPDGEVYRYIQKSCKGGEENIKIVLEKRIDATVDIIVVDDKTDKPVEGIGVMISSAKTDGASMKTDSNGKVYFECPWKDKYKLSVVSLSRRNFKPNSLKITESKEYEVEIRIKNIEKWYTYKKQP